MWPRAVVSGKLWCIFEQHSGTLPVAFSTANCDLQVLLLFCFLLIKSLPRVFVEYFYLKEFLSLALKLDSSGSDDFKLLMLTPQPQFSHPSNGLLILASKACKHINCIPLAEGLT